MKFSVNGITVEATPLGNGMYAAVPVNPLEMLTAILSGKFEQDPAKMDIRPIEDTPTPKAVAVPKANPVSETVAQYRERTGLSNTALADRLNISRRTLGRWENRGVKMAEVR
jgi:DNA-binding transcriptional regulator YiaG